MLSQPASLRPCMFTILMARATIVALQHLLNKIIFSIFCSEKSLLSLTRWTCSEFIAVFLFGTNKTWIDVRWPHSGNSYLFTLSAIFNLYDLNSVKHALASCGLITCIMAIAIQCNCSVIFFNSLYAKLSFNCCKGEYWTMGLHVSWKLTGSILIFTCLVHCLYAQGKWKD